MLPIAFVFVSYLQHQKDLSDKALALGVVKDPKVANSALFVRGWVRPPTTLADTPIPTTPRFFGEESLAHDFLARPKKVAGDKPTLRCSSGYRQYLYSPSALFCF